MNDNQIHVINFAKFQEEYSLRKYEEKKQDKDLDNVQNI